MFSHIRVISFDLDDTLWPCGSVIQRAEQQLYDWLAEHAPAIPANYSIQAMRDLRLVFQRANPDIAHDLTQVRQRSLQQLLDIHGYPRSLGAQGTALFREARGTGWYQLPMAMQRSTKPPCPIFFIDPLPRQRSVLPAPTRPCFRRCWIGLRWRRARFCMLEMTPPGMWTPHGAWDYVQPGFSVGKGSGRQRSQQMQKLM